MSKAAVIVDKNHSERGYSVRCGKHYDLWRTFIYGEFDCGTITWREARSAALKYANDWARTTRRRLQINL